MATKEHKWEFYQDKAGKHRWRRIASNGNIIGASSQGYVTPKDYRKTRDSTVTPAHNRS